MKKIVSLVERIQGNYFNIPRLRFDLLIKDVLMRDVEACFILGLVFMKEGQGTPFPDFFNFSCISFNDDPAMEFFNQGIDLIKFSAENGNSVAVPVLNYFLFELDMSNRGKQNPYLLDEQDAICRAKILDQDIYNLFSDCE